MTSYGIRQMNNNTSAQYMVLKIQVFPSFIYNTFTYYNTPTRLVPTLQKTTNKQNKIQGIVFTLTNTLRRVKIVSGMYYRPK